MNRFCFASIATVIIAASLFVGTSVSFSSFIGNGNNNCDMAYMIDVVADNGQSYKGNVYVCTDGEGNAILKKSDGDPLQLLCMEINSIETTSMTMEVYAEGSELPLFEVELILHNNVLTQIGKTTAGIDTVLMMKAIFTASDGFVVCESIFFPNPGETFMV